MTFFSALALSLWTPVAAAADWPDIDSPLRTGASAPADAAVVIGIEDYPFLTKVPYARRDADAFYDYLAYTRGVPSANLHRLNGGDRNQMETALREAAAEVQSGGVLWVYFAGHGGGDPATGDRLLVGDTAKNDAASFATGSLSVEDVKRIAGTGAGEVMLVIDACYNGLGRDGGQYGDTRFAIPPDAPTATRGVTEWSAAAPTQLASPLHEVDHGAFTYFVVGALRGWADGELGQGRDGAVSLEEARMFVQQALRSVGVRDQTPEMNHASGLDALSSGGEPSPDLRALSNSYEVVGAIKSSGGDDDLLADVSDITRTLKEAERLKVQLEAAREVGLDEAERTLRSQATRTWTALGELRALGGQAAVAKVEAFVTRYDSAEAEWVDPEGAWTRRVTIAEVQEARLWLNNDSAGEISAGQSGYAMVKVEPGLFTMGQSAQSADAKPAHEVELSRPFWIGKAEVTQGLYRQVMGENPSKNSRCGDSCPVDRVSWLDAAAFANTLSEREGLETCYTLGASSVSWPRGLDCQGYRLPTEAEWEYAARADEGRAYSGADEHDAVAWVAENSGGQPHPVSLKRPNAWGIYDMSGNVWEWVWDRYSDSYYKSSPGMNPTGPTSGDERVNRGGSWSYDEASARIDLRDRWPADSGNDDLGFRLVRSSN